VRRVLLLAASILATCPVDAAAEWRFLHTEHFQLIGDVSARQLRDVALRFEQFRDIATRLKLAPTGSEAASPLTIVVFRNQKSFEPFMPRNAGRVVDSAGMFVEGPDSVYIAVRLDRGEESFRAVFHEYSHLLLKRVFPEAPVWFNEGMAEFYSTLRITGDRSALIGFPVTAHATLLQQQSMPLTQMFAATASSSEYSGETATRQLLYAQSWAVMHYAFQSSRSKEILELARKLAAGADVEAAVRSTYGMSVSELETRVIGYIRGGVYSAVAITFGDEIANGVTDGSVPISDPEADGWLGDLLAQLGRDDEAKARLEGALSRQPGVLQAHEALALIFLRTNRQAEANAHLQQLQAVGINVEDILRRSRAAAPPGGFRQEPSTTPSAPLPPGARLFLRITLADERRSFGTLESLNCRGQDVEFVVRTNEGTVRASGRFGEIRVITYREESVGDLRCGQDTRSLPVLLTWKPADGESRRAIAVEFLPDGFVP
jgi:hypothetical protein